ncbi:hypothetical protein DES53_101178 [Roseimicrobium gellanilyticum]|uniref:Uncharacterized protein n=1 Tax=Roseimicrobium gellanilyticum TaxID=748857 RepID=A0A366HSX5_9BACT|nr:hypothetical protein [Roseimicrobium gellanilyticum]RBP47381.1 hypothetical protein DES53_101178 [Roseimicrobium gellanilyticum]
MLAWNKFAIGMVCFLAAFSLLTTSAGAQQQVTVTLQAYEVARDDAAALLIAQPEKLDPATMVQTLSAMSAKQASKILKLGSVSGPSGGRSKGSGPDGSFEASATLSADGQILELIVSATAVDLKLAAALMMPGKGFAFMGALDQGDSGKVVMFFVRSS